VRKTRCWLKIEPDLQFGKQYGWKVVGVTRGQPKTGHAIFLELNIEGPDMIAVEVPATLVHVRTEADKIAEELSGT